VDHGPRARRGCCADGRLLGFRVIVNDPIVDREHYPAAARLITDDIDYRQLQPAAGDYVVIATQHKGDHESLKQALGSPAGYIALIASRKRSRLVLDYLREAGFDAAALERVMAPAGLDLGARTPEEIALCVSGRWCSSAGAAPACACATRCTVNSADRKPWGE
jgi:xanthine dehydrogenase accessory factor